MQKLLIAGSALITLLPFAIAAADRPPPRQPPAEAFAACAKLKAGDTCSVTFGSQTISGVCSTGPDGGGALACKPDRPPGPPPEAIQACANSAEGDACSVAFGDHTISGKCAKGPDGNGPLACKPDQPPPH
jgi:hypothetical protein